MSKYCPKQCLYIVQLGGSSFIFSKKKCLCFFWCIFIYGWFCLATAKVCCSWWKLRFCNCCHFLPCRKNVLKFFVHIIWVLKHSDFQFEHKQIFFNNLKNFQKTRLNPNFRIFFYILKKNLFALKFKVWVLTNPNNMQNKFQKVFFTGQKITGIAKSQFSPAAGNFCSW